MQLKNKNYFPGLLSSLGVLFLLTLYLIALFSPLIIPRESVWKSAVTTYYSIKISNSFLDYFVNSVFFSTAPLILILFACFHQIALRSHKIYSLIALSLIISSTVLRTFSFIGQIELSHFNINAFDNEYLSYHIYNSLSSYIFSVHIISVTIFIGLAELLVIPIFPNKTRIENNLRIVFFISGILNLLSAFPFKTSYGDRSGLFFILSQLFMIIAMVFCAKYFRQIKMNYSE
jgi:hypothetical protein